MVWRVIINYQSNIGGSLGGRSSVGCCCRRVSRGRNENACRWRGGGFDEDGAGAGGGEGGLVGGDVIYCVGCGGG